MGYKANNGLEYSRAAIFSWPSKELKNGKDDIDIQTERKFRDICYDVLAKACKKIPADKSIAAWSDNHRLTQKVLKEKGKFSSLDEIFTDESVANILVNYYVP